MFQRKSGISLIRCKEEQQFHDTFAACVFGSPVMIPAIKSDIFECDTVALCMDNRWNLKGCFIVTIAVVHSKEYFRILGLKGGSESLAIF